MEKQPNSTANTIAAIASFFIPGLGQLTQIRVLRAVAFFIAAILLWIISLGWIIHIWAAIDAAKGPQPKANDTKPPSDPWYSNRIDAELEDYELVFPPIPNAIFDAIYFTKGYDSHIREAYLNTGDWVKKDDQIHRLSSYPDGNQMCFSGERPGVYVRKKNPPGGSFSNTTNIVAPFSGKLTLYRGDRPDITAGTDDFWGDEPGEFKKGIEFYPDGSCYPAILKIRPMKGTDISNSYYLSFRHVISWCESLVRDDERMENASKYTSVGFYSDPNNFRNAILKGIEHIRHYKPIVRPINRGSN